MHSDVILEKITIAEDKKDTLQREGDTRKHQQRFKRDKEVSCPHSG